MGTKTVFGVFLIAVGILTVIGGVTGNLGVMMAAMLDPSDLANAGGSSSSTTEIPGAPGGGGGGSSKATVPGEPGGGLVASI